MANIQQLRALQTELMVNEAVTGEELEALRQEIYADGKVDRTEAEILLEIYKKAPSIGPNLRTFFFKAIKDHVLQDGKITADEATWLREKVLSIERMDKSKKKLLNELRGEAGASVSPEFESLCADCI